MGRLVVESITAEDFLSYYEPQTIVFNGRGPVAITGINGAGKSSMVSKGLTWCFYGSCTEERMGSGTRAIKGRGVVRLRLEGKQLATPDAKLARVRTVLRKDDGGRVAIERSRTKSNKDVIKVLALDATGETEIGSDQSTIDGLLGVGYEVFTRTVVRGQNDPWNFAEATDSRKREIVDAISGADKLGVPHHRAVEAGKAARVDEAVCRARAEDAEKHADAANLVVLAQQVDDWNVAQTGRLTALRQEQADAMRRLAQAQTEDQHVTAAQQRRTALEAQCPTLDMAPYTAAVTAATGVHAQAQAALEGRRREIDHAAHLLATGRCPTCGQDTHVGEIRMRAQAGIHGEDIRLKSAKTHLDACLVAQRDAEAWLSNAIATWQGQLSMLPVVMTAKVPVVEAELNQIKHRLADLESAVNPHVSALAQARSRCAELLREAAVFREAERSAKGEAMLAGAWEQVLHPKGFRAQLAEGSLLAIENEANKWLSVLSRGRLQVRFPPTKTTGKGAVKEDIQTIVLFNGIEIDFLNLSGGEKTRVNFACDLGVAAVFSQGRGLALSLLVIDEAIVSGLDSEGKTAVIRAIHNAGIADTVVIDHDPVLNGSLPRTVEVFRGPDDYSRLREVVA